MGEEQQRAPDHIGRVAGCRVWRIAPTLWARMGGLLWATWMREPWQNGKEHEAICPPRGCPNPPLKECTCGIYAFSDESGMDRQNPIGKVGGFWHVGGVIGASGRILPALYGFRAAKAKVMAIFNDDFPTDKEEIAHAYGVPIIDRRDYDAFCAEAGLLRLGQDGKIR